MTDRTNPHGAHALSPSERLPPAVRTVIGLMLVSAFIVILNETIMAVALPRLMEDLNISAGVAQWLTTGYLLTMAVVIPLTGRIMERFSTRAVFSGAMSLFTIGTVVAAASPGFEILLVGRVVQAAGTAVMLPLLMTTVLNFVPAQRRGRMMGLISVVISVAPAVGPTVSGLILSVLDWRWLFILVAPIAAAALLLGLRLVTNITTTRKVAFDLPSMLLSALGFGGVVFGLSSIGEAVSDHATIPPGVTLSIGVLALGIFAYRQIRLQADDRALMNLLPFAVPAFTVPVLLIVLSFAILFGSLILLPIFAQNVLGLDTLQTGLVLLPGGLTMGLAAPLVGRLFDRFGPRPLVVPATMILSGSLWGLSTLGVGTPVAVVIVIYMALSLGLAMLLTPLMTSALGSLPKALYPHGSAIVNTLQQVAGAAGTAVFVTLMTAGAAATEIGGAGPVAAQAAGIQGALVVGACASLAGIILGLFVKAPTDPVAAPLPIH